MNIHIINWNDFTRIFPSGENQFKTIMKNLRDFKLDDVVENTIVVNFDSEGVAVFSIENLSVGLNHATVNYWRSAK